MSRNLEDACSRFHHDPNSGFRHLIADRTSEECPFHGRFQDMAAPKSTSSCGNGWINGGCPVSSHVQIRMCNVKQVLGRISILRQLSVLIKRNVAKKHVRT